MIYFVYHSEMDDIRPTTAVAGGQKWLIVPNDYGFLESLSMY